MFIFGWKVLLTIMNIGQWGLAVHKLLSRTLCKTWKKISDWIWQGTLTSLIRKLSRVKRQMYSVFIVGHWIRATRQKWRQFRTAKVPTRGRLLLGQTINTKNDDESTCNPIHTLIAQTGLLAHGWSPRRFVNRLTRIAF